MSRNRKRLPTLRHSTSLFGLIWILSSATATVLDAQANPQTTGTPTDAKQFVQSPTVPSPVRGYLAAFGDRIQTPGKERSILRGTYTSKNGSGQAQLIWEVPGNVRFDRSDQPGKALIFTKAAGLASSSTSRAQADADILESLMDDAAESFFYGFQRAVAHRFLGAGFGADDGSRDDIYESHGPVRAQPGRPSRLKHYYFDSRTKLLDKTHYLISDVDVTTEFNKWTTINGQSFPGQIVRKENGSPIFTFTVDSAAVGPSVNDNTFSGQ